MIKHKISSFFPCLCLTSQGNLVITTCFAFTEFPCMSLPESYVQLFSVYGCMGMFLLRLYTNSPLSKRKPEISAYWGMNSS